MKRRQALTAGVAIAAAAGGAGWAWWRQPGSTLPAAEQALWAQRFDKPGGGQLAMNPLRGRPVLLNFWATWCAPCIKEMPLLDAFQRQHGPQGWQVVGLAVDGLEPVRAFLAKRPVSFSIGLAGPDGVALSRSLGNAQGGLPFSVVLDRRGAVVFRKTGALDSAELAEWARQMS